MSVKGNLVFLLHKPNNEAAYFTGPGLDSINKALCNVDNFKLTNGATVCDIIIVNNKVQIKCKGINGRFFQILFDENMIFQKLSDQERIILQVLDHLN